VRPSSRTPPVHSTMLKCSVHATARRSVRLHGAPTLPRPQPTTYALRREGNLRRTPLWRGRIASAARAQPSHRARPSAAPAATLPLLSHCSSPRLNTDSPQTILSGARTRRFRSNCSCALRRWPSHLQRPVVSLRFNRMWVATRDPRLRSDSGSER